MIIFALAAHLPQPVGGHIDDVGVPVADHRIGADIKHHANIVVVGMAKEAGIAAHRAGDQDLGG